MASSPLEVISSHGDQTLPRIRFVVRAAVDSAAYDKLAQEGLGYVEGGATVSTDLVGEHDVLAAAAGGVGDGSVAVFAVPPEVYVGAGVFSTAYVDRDANQVGGAPLRYAAARRYVGLYNSPDTETVRLHIESEVASGYDLNQRPHYVISPQYLLGKFTLSPGLAALIRQLDVGAQSLQSIETERLENALRQVFTPATPASEVLASPVMRDLVVNAVESIVLMRLRMMRWQGLALVGYGFFEDQAPVKVPELGDIGAYRRRVDEVGRHLATSNLFVGDLVWLKGYAARELQLMRVELDGYEASASKN